MLSSDSERFESLCLAHFQSTGGATRNNDFCLRSLEQMRPLGQCQIYHWWLQILRSEQLGISFINSYSPLHLIIITLSTIFKSSEWYLLVLERRHMLRINITLTESGDIAYSELGIDLNYSLWNDVHTKTDYWVTAKPKFGWETHVWIHCYGIVWMNWPGCVRRNQRGDL